MGGVEDGGQKPAELAGHNVGVFIGSLHTRLQNRSVRRSELRDAGGPHSDGNHDDHGIQPHLVLLRLPRSKHVDRHRLQLIAGGGPFSLSEPPAPRELPGHRRWHAAAYGASVHHSRDQRGIPLPVGLTRTFDAAANGYVRAEGVAVLVLKLLNDAIREGDPIHAVIIGSGVNQDGRTNGITVPSANAQITLIQKVCAEAGIEPGWLQYVEAHGTSTPVGDPIEANARGACAGVRPKTRLQMLCGVGKDQHRSYGIGCWGRQHYQDLAEPQVQKDPATHQPREHQPRN